MNGIYIHIPFCKKVCYYCDFHFTVSLSQKDALLDALIKEFEIRKEYLGTGSVSTIYFGGGTPSILSIHEVERILQKINALFSVDKTAEITLEANPDDLSLSYLQDLRKLGINRLSIGVQSFFDEDLKWMNRRHTSREAENCIKLSQDCGFSNINVDLIYGLPQLSNGRWQQNLHKFIALDIPHLSAYHLTIEPKTVFGYYKRKGRLTETDEEMSLRQYKMLIETMREHGFDHYEISNFCKRQLYSRHNTNYWQSGHYLGIGPSAHSYNGMSRQWNVSVNSDYMTALNKGTSYFGIEQLTDTEKFNDYLLTGLRTKWGIDLDFIKNSFGIDYLRLLEKELTRFSDSRFMTRDNQKILLTEEGMFISDKIIAEFFI
jgi:oxygen-independent coproporphyrinogen-3 oxidase